MVMTTSVPGRGNDQLELGDHAKSSPSTSTPAGPDEEDKMEIPDGGYGWVIVCCQLCINSVTWGECPPSPPPPLSSFSSLLFPPNPPKPTPPPPPLPLVLPSSYLCRPLGVNTTFGVYSAYYLQNNYFHGGSTIRYAWVGGLCAGVGLLAPLANAITTFTNFRVTLALGVICACLGQCMAGISKSYGTFLVTQGVVFGLGLIFTLAPSQPILAHWFRKRLALAQVSILCQESRES